MAQSEKPKIHVKYKKYVHDDRFPGARPCQVHVRESHVKIYFVQKYLETKKQSVRDFVYDKTSRCSISDKICKNPAKRFLSR